ARVVGVVVAGCRREPEGDQPHPATIGIGESSTRQMALAELQQARADVKVEGHAPDQTITQVDFRSAPVGDDGLQVLHYFPELTFVGLLGCPVTDSGMEHLRNLTA